MRLAQKVTPSGFVPPRLLRNRHVQTLLPALWPSRERVPFSRERIELPDGDYLDLSHAGQGSAPTVVLIPGLGGDASSPYVQELAARVRGLEWNAVVLHLRGTSGEPNRLARTHHHGDTDDVHVVANLLRRRIEPHPLMVVGWSLGAGVVIKGLGEAGKASPFHAGAAICAPLRIRDCANHMSTGVARIYQAMLLRHLKSQLLRKHAQVPLPAEMLRDALAAQDFMSFGTAYTAPTNGFTDVDDYCARAACGPYLERVRRPLLVLQSEDDPVLGGAALPESERWSRQVRMEIAQHGGHVGFVDVDTSGRPLSWASAHVLAFLRDAPR